MTTFHPWYAHELEGSQLLEAHEDWLIQMTDTLGHVLSDDFNSPLLSECLDCLKDGLQSFIGKEAGLLQILGAPQSAHHGLLDFLHQLSEQHARGETVGDLLLAQLQMWLIEHSGQAFGHAVH